MPEPAGKKEATKKPAAKRPPPTLEEAKSSVQLDPNEAEDKFEEKFSAKAVQSELRFTHLSGLQDHYKHKKYWSWFLMFIMFAMVIFQSVVLLLVGEGRWDFTKYQWLLPALLVQTLAQVVGLAHFVVKSLFASLGKVWE